MLQTSKVIYFHLKSSANDKKYQYWKSAKMKCQLSGCLSINHLATNTKLILHCYLGYNFNRNESVFTFSCDVQTQCPLNVTKPKLVNNLQETEYPAWN